MTSDPEALARLAFELVSVPSVTGEEAALAELVETRCRALPGVAVERLGNSLVVRAGERDDAVALVGHLDTVPPWDDHGRVLEGTRVIGRGAADIKGGDAAILAVLEHAPRGLRVVVGLLRPRGGARPPERPPPVLRDSTLVGRPAFAFVGEPTCCTVHAGCVGSINADVVFHGRTGHSARPGRATTRSSAPCRSWSARPHGAVDAGGRRGPEFHDTLCVRDPAASRATSCPTGRARRSTRASRPAAGGDRARRIEQLVAGEGRSDVARRGPGGERRPVEAAARALHRRDGRARCGRSRPGRTWRRCSRSASRRSTTAPARRTRRTSPASGSTARRSRGSRRRSRRSSRAQASVATVGRMRLAKWQALGNHFLASEEPPSPITPARARILCDPALGLGADGVLELTPATPTSRSSAEPRRLDRRGLGQRHAHRGRLGRRAPRARRSSRPTDAARARAACSPTAASPSASGTADARRARRTDRAARAPGAGDRFVSVGNPHMVLDVDDPRAFPLETEEGPRLERTRASPSARTSRRSRRSTATAELRVWERGVGETQACGSGACAAAVAAIVDGRCARPVMVEMPGGSVEVGVDAELGAHADRYRRARVRGRARRALVAPLEQAA